MNDTDNEDKRENKIKNSSQQHDSFVKDLNSLKPDLSNTKGYNPFGLIDGIEKNKKKNTSSQ